MKKIIIFMILFILTPLNIKANEINNITISGTNDINQKEEFTLDFKIDLQEFNRSENIGIWLTEFELIYNKDLFIISEIISNDFNSYLYKENDKTYLISEVIESDSNNLCANKLLLCSDYQVTIKFYLKETTLTETEIKLLSPKIGILDMSKGSNQYTENDIEYIYNETETIHKLNIKNESINKIDEPMDITTTQKKEITTKQNNHIKSSNAFIKNITIKDYQIDFKKNNTSYYLNVPKNINSLDIKIDLEDQKSTYKVIGANDLRNNNNEVAIIVTSEDGTTLTYLININYEEQIKENNKESSVKVNEFIDKYLTKENITYLFIGIGIIIILILIIILKNKRENKKINKLLGEL